MLAKFFDNSNKKRNDYIVFAAAFAAFIACAVSISIYGDFAKAISVLPDEQRYLDILRSIAGGNPITIGGEISTYQKIGYSLFLLPAMLFSDIPSQLHAIGVLNSVYIAATVFPVVLIARKLFNTTAPCVIAAVLSPILVYPASAIGFMSENVSIPLILLILYLCICQLESNGNKALVLSGVIGVLFYLVYLVKETSVLVFVAFVIVLIIDIVKQKERKRQDVSCIVVALFCFAVPFIIMKLTYFAGMGNSYNQLNSEGLFTMPILLYGISWALPQNIALTLLGFYMVIALSPVIEYSRMSKQDKQLALICLISIVLFVLVITWSISMLENLGMYRLGFHYRYFGVFFLPMFLLFLKYGIFSPSQEKIHSKVSIAVIVTIACMLALFFASVALPSSASEAHNFWMTVIADSVIEYDPVVKDVELTIKPYITIYPMGILLSCLSCEMLIAYTYYAFSKDIAERRKLNTITAIIIVVCACVSSAWQMQDAHTRYAMTPDNIVNGVEMMSEANSLAEEGNEVLVLLSLGEKEQANRYSIKHPARWRRELIVTCYDNTSQKLKYATESDEGNQIEALDRRTHSQDVTVLEASDFDYMLASEEYDSDVLPASAVKIKSWQFNAADVDEEPCISEISLYKISRD